MKYFEASISQISIRTFAFRRSLGEHSTNLLTGLARRRPLMASPPELDLLTSSGSSCWCCVLLYNKFLPVALIKTQTFTRISWYSLYITYIYIDLLLSRPDSPVQIPRYIMLSMSCCIVLIPLIDCLRPLKCTKHQHCPKPRLYAFHLDPILIPGILSWYVEWVQGNICWSCQFEYLHSCHLPATNI